MSGGVHTRMGRDSVVALATAAVSIVVVAGALAGLSGWSESVFEGADSATSGATAGAPGGDLLSSSARALESPTGATGSAGGASGGGTGSGAGMLAPTSPAVTDFSDDVVANLALEFHVAFTTRLADDAAAGLIDRVPIDWSCTPRDGTEPDGTVDPTPGVLDCFAVTADDGTGTLVGAAYVVHINWRGGLIDIDLVGPELR